MNSVYKYKQNWVKAMSTLYRTAFRADMKNTLAWCEQKRPKPIRYVTIHFQDRNGAASLRCKNRAEISDPFVNRSPIRYGFCVGAQAIRYSVDIDIV